eukprot:GHVU01022150.1.p1 GENE.GHVU01022150.1~~GHVU01022150.1.p1  ORF type:complete len:108 (+),score=7.77 GHVU01022150.1:347-670(+)
MQRDMLLDFGQDATELTVIVKAIVNDETHAVPSSAAEPLPAPHAPQLVSTLISPRENRRATAASMSQKRPQPMEKHVTGDGVPPAKRRKEDAASSCCSDTDEYLCID